jgi:hypothetical protein
MRKIITIIFITLFVTVAHAQEQSSHELFDQLPRQARTDIVETRQACKEAIPESDTAWGTWQDTGLNQIFLDKTKAIVIDWRSAACEDKGIGRCSTGGCDLDIYIGSRKVFHELVEQHFISTTYDGRLKLLAVSIGYGGNDQCKADTPKHIPGGLQICDALVFWRNGHWVWQPIREEERSCVSFSH